MGFWSLMTPILAAVSLMFLMKAVGLGNIFNPVNALDMATGGAGKILGSDKDKAQAKATSAFGARDGAKTAKSLQKKLDDRGAKVRDRTVKREKDKQAKDAQRKAVAERQKVEENAKALASPSADPKGEVADLPSELSVDQARAALGEDTAGSDAGMDNLQLNGDAAQMLAEHAEDQRVLDAAAAASGGGMAQEALRASHLSSHVRDIASGVRTDLEIGPGDALSDVPLAQDALLEKARMAHAELVGTDQDRIYADPSTGSTFLAPSVKSVFPEGLEAGARELVARDPATYLDKAAVARLTQGSPEETAAALTYALALKGLVDHSGARADMAKVLDLPAGETFASAVRAGGEELYERNKISFTEAELETVHAAMSQDRVVSRVRSRRDPATRIEVATRVCAGDVTRTAGNVAAAAQSPALRELSVTLKTAVARSAPESASRASSSVDAALSASWGSLRSQLDAVAAAVDMSGVQTSAASALTARIEELRAAGAATAAQISNAAVRGQASAETPDQFKQLFTPVQSSLKDFVSRNATVAEGLQSELERVLAQGAERSQLATSKGALKAPKRGKSFLGS